MGRHREEQQPVGDGGQDLGALPAEGAAHPGRPLGEADRGQAERHLRDIRDGARRGLHWQPELAGHALGFLPAVFTVTDGGFAKRTRVSEYREQGRGGLGIKAMKLNEDRGSLVGGLVVSDNDEVIAIKASGQITRSSVAEVPVKGRDTMGVKFVGVRDNDSVVVIALNPEAAAEVVELTEEPDPEEPIAP